MNFFFTHLINIILGRAGIFYYDVLNFFLYSYGIAMEIKKSSRKLMLFLFELSYFASRLKMRSEEVMKKRKKIKKKSEKQEIPVCLKLNWVIFAK